MAKIKEVIYYFLINYPYKDELSKTRLTKMVYLADWESAKKYGRQITKINWYFDHYGPYVPDVYEVALKDRKLAINRGFSAFGSPKETIEFDEGYVDFSIEKVKLNLEQAEILDKVIEDTKYLNWSDFISYVYSTEPIKFQDRYKNLDLVVLAKEI
ncbi:Panacea domain-containing protein [Oceanobacillus kimchii]|uniref:Panacea domain-containing protein n=1 Tax=Oceanobacillus kimchii TaxID=746691 RepID=UPI003B0175CB